MIERWGTAALSLWLSFDPDRPVRLAGLTNDGTPLGLSKAALPLVELELAGDGKVGTSGTRHVDGSASQRLRPVERESTLDGDRQELVIRMRDPVTGLLVAAHFAAYADIPVVRCWVELTARDDVVVEHVSSFAFGGLASALSAPAWEQDLRLWTADNPWSGELRWSGRPLAEHGLIDVGMTRYGQTGSKNRVLLSSCGSWPSGQVLPSGWIESDSGVLAWQIEHNGSWLAELGDRHDDVYLILSGPAQREHQWSVRLAPGESFTSVPVAVAVADHAEAALSALTSYRRRTRRPHPDNEALPVVFNDFMNCLLGDPTTEKLLPLVTAAAAAGAEYFCVDAGWFDDDQAGEPLGRAARSSVSRAPGPGGVPGWWDEVGAWEPSAKRFPGGLAEVTDAIRAAGMIPGLWLEPEVVGVHSPIAARLPDEAFFGRGGRRIAEWGRYQLDLSHPAAVAHLDATVDRLVREYGVGYLKLDYNIDIGAGTGDVPGAGLLRHNRAYLAWLRGVLDRHPDLVLEGCAAGGMRLDHATLSAVALQSVTDQQDDRLIAAIAVAAPTVTPPEQGAIWAYPQPEFGPERIAFTMVSAMLGRVHLSGRPDLLDGPQSALVAEALEVYKGYRRELSRGVPRWPLGLPGWRDGWLALAIDAETATYLAVWRRDAPEDTCELPVAGEAELLYPTGLAGRWSSDGERLSVTLPEGSARLFRLRRLPDGSKIAGRRSEPGL